MRGSNDQVSLGEFIKILEGRPADEVWSPGLAAPHSYRGHYDELAFEPVESATVGDMLREARGVLGKTLTGYKGGKYVMHEHVGVWAANYGDCGYEVQTESNAFLIPPESS